MVRGGARFREGAPTATLLRQTAGDFATNLCRGGVAGRARGNPARMRCRPRSALRRMCAGVAGAILACGGVAYARECDGGALDVDATTRGAHRHGRVAVDGQAGGRWPQPPCGREGGVANGRRRVAGRLACRAASDGHRVAGAGRAAGRRTPSSSPRWGLDRRALKAQIASYARSARRRSAVRCAPRRRIFRRRRPARSCSFRRRGQLRSAEPLLGRRRAGRGGHRRQHPGDRLSGRGARAAPAAVHRRPRSRRVPRCRRRGRAGRRAARAGGPGGTHVHAGRPADPGGPPPPRPRRSPAGATPTGSALTRTAGTPCRSAPASGSRRPR